MFDCTTCNQNAEEIPLDTRYSAFGIIARRHAVYLRITDEPCEECGDGPGRKVMLYTDRYIAPVERACAAIESLIPV